MELLGRDSIVHLVFSPKICPELQLPDVLMMAKRSGFSRIQLERLDSASSPAQKDTSVRMVRDRLEGAMIKLSGLTVRSLTGRKADSDERNLAYNLRQIEWDIHLARAIRTKNVALSGGAKGLEAFEDLVEGIRILIQRVPDVSIILTNKSGSCFSSLHDAQEIISKIDDPRFQIRIDADELLICGEDVIEFTSAIGDRIGDVALRCGNDIKFGGLVYNEELVGRFIARLKNLKFMGSLIVQGNPSPIQEGVDLLQSVRENIQKMIN